MPQPSWCRNLTKRATVSIDVLFINTISDAVHSCTCHDVPGRALNRLVINRTSTSATDKMCGGRFIPFTGRIVHFIASKPQTGLAQRHCISDSVFLPSSDLSWKADMFRKIKIRKMTLNRALDKYVTAPRPVGRGFPLLRPLPSVRRIYAGLHGQKRRVPPPLVPVFLFAGY